MWTTEIGPELRALAVPFERALERGQEAAARELRAAYQVKILEVGAYRTGEFHRSVVVANPNKIETTRVIDVDSDIYRSPAVAAARPQGIGDIIERGRRPPVNYPGRFPAKQGIEAAEPKINAALDEEVTKTIRIIER